MSSGFHPLHPIKELEVEVQQAVWKEGELDMASSSTRIQLELCRDSPYVCHLVGSLDL